MYFVLDELLYPIIAVVTFIKGKRYVITINVVFAQVYHFFWNNDANKLVSRRIHVGIDQS